MKPYIAFGEPLNAVGVLARYITQDNATAAFAHLGRALVNGVDEKELEYLKRVAVARQRKADRAYQLKPGEAIRVQKVM
jgi:hypothetical protein